MNELKQRLEALGLTQEQIDGALQTIAAFVKEKVPANYSWIVDSVLSGQTPDLSQLEGDVLGKIKGMFD